MEHKPTILTSRPCILVYETTGNDDIDAIVKNNRFLEVVSVSDGRPKPENVKKNVCAFFVTSCQLTFS
jgi:hypothetical protein